MGSPWKTAVAAGVGIDADGKGEEEEEGFATEDTGGVERERTSTGLAAPLTAGSSAPATLLSDDCT